MKRTIATLVVALTLLTTGTVLGASVTPTIIPGANNDGKSCAEQFPGTTELKVDLGTSGNYPVTGGSVTVVKPSTLAPSNNSIDFTSTGLDIVGVIVKDGIDGANSYDYSAAPVTSDTYLTTPFDGAKNISHVIFCWVPGGDEADNLAVTKTAVPEYTRTFHWTIEKTADTDTVYSAGGGESGAVEWTIEVTKDAGTDSAWAISGTITVTNSSSSAINDVDLSDSTPNGTCTLDDDNVDVPANSSVDVDYTCTFASNPGSGTNTATATASDDSSTSGTADYTFGDPTNLVNDSIDVTDDNSPDSPYHFTASGSVSFEQTFTDEEGTCTSHDNTASIDGTDQDSTASTQDCQGADLIVTKDATPSFDRAYTWEIDKSVDGDSSVNLLPGAAGATFGYTVLLSHDNGTDSNWKVNGTITVTNPNDWESVTLTSVSDLIDNGGDCTVDTTGGMVVAASGSLDFPYECLYDEAPTADDFTNTATATWSAAAAHTINGTDDGTADGTFGAPTEPTNVTDECVNVDDSLEGDQGDFCVDDAGQVNNTFTIQYSHFVANPGLGKCVTVDNTATFVANDTPQTGSDSASVTVCTYNAALTIGYWRNHLNPITASCKSNQGCSNNGPWTVPTLNKSICDGACVSGKLSNLYTVTTQAQAVAVFDANNCSNASTSNANAASCLAAQLLAAELNVANKANTCICPTIQAAKAFLSAVIYKGPGFAVTFDATHTRAQAIALKTLLDDYNNGKGCQL